MKKANNNNPFKVPDDYFDDFDGKLMSKLSSENTRLPKEDGFKVPDDYFDAFNDALHQKIKGQETKVIQLHSYKKYYFLAASIVAIAIFVWGFHWNTQQNIDFDSLASSDIDSYFEENSLELSSYEIAEVLPLDNLQTKDFLEESVEEAQLLEYLDEHVDDFEELNLQEDE